MPRKPHALWPRFDLGFLLFWVTPYIAAITALTTWNGPYANAFLNRTARLSAIIGVTIAWITLYASRRASRRDDDPHE